MTTRRRVELRGQAGQHERRGRECEQDGGRSRPAVIEALVAVLQTADEERRAQNQQQVGEDRADQRRLDHRQEAGAQREERDEQLRQVAERALQHAGRAGPEPVAEPFDAAADQSGEQCDGHAGADERQNLVQVGIERDRGERHRGQAAANDHQVGAAERERSGALRHVFCRWVRDGCLGHR